MLLKMASHEIKQKDWSNAWTLASEIALRCELWNKISTVSTSSNKMLQSSTIVMTPAIAFLKNLNKLSDECGEKVWIFWQMMALFAIHWILIWKSVNTQAFKKSMSVMWDAVEGIWDEQKFNVNTFYVSIKQLKYKHKNLSKHITWYSRGLFWLNYDS